MIYDVSPSYIHQQNENHRVDSTSKHIQHCTDSSKSMKNILLAAECPQLWTKLHKIRIQKHQEEASANGLSHRDIQQQIVDYINMDMNVIINSENFNTNANKHQYSEDDISVELYHPSGKFVPLLRNENNHDSSDNDACSLDDAFGTRIRCIVHLITDEDKTNNNCNPCIRFHQDVDPGPLLIKGRYFEYNPDGMDFAGKKLIVKEEVNNKDEDGTGLNVWDGSLLLARFLEKYPNKVSSKHLLLRHLSSVLYCTGTHLVLYCTTSGAAGVLHLLKLLHCINTLNYSACNLQKLTSFHSPVSFLLIAILL